VAAEFRSPNSILLHQRTENGQIRARRLGYQSNFSASDRVRFHHDWHFKSKTGGRYAVKITDIKCAVIADSPVVRIVTDEGIDGWSQIETPKPYAQPQVLPATIRPRRRRSVCAASAASMIQPSWQGPSTLPTLGLK
jgi:hypothetical protein